MEQIKDIGKLMHSVHPNYPNEYIFDGQHKVLHNIMADYQTHLQAAGLAVPNSPSRMPRYSYALAFWSEYVAKTLNLVVDEKGDGYIEWPKHRVAFTKDSEGNYTVFSSTPGMSSVTLTMAISAFSYIENNFIGNTDQTPEGFCLDVWYNFANNATVYQEVNYDIASIINKLDEPLALIGELDPSLGCIKKAKKTTTKQAVNDSFDYDAAKAGAYAIDYPWPDEVKKYIQPYSYLDEYVLTKQQKSIIKLLSFRLKKIQQKMKDGETEIKAFAKLLSHIALSGPAGTGKTSFVYFLSALFQMPLFAIAVNPNTGDEFVQGETKMVGSELVFVESIVCQWAKCGGLLLIDEMVTANTDMMFGILAELVEYPFHLYSNGCDEVIRHPLSIAFIAYNNNIVGGKTITQPLISRFSQAYEFEKPNRDDFIALLENYGNEADYGYSTRTVCEWVYDAYEASLNYLNSNRATDIATALSLRGCFAVLDAIESGEDFIEALRCFWVIVKHYSEKHANALKNDIYTSLRDISSY